MLHLIDVLKQDNSSEIYIALRLFDIAEKIKAEYLEQAVIDGVQLAAGEAAPIKRKFTFVPFRDSVQAKNADIIHTKTLYENDIKHINKSVMIVTYLDGLSKDEGVCFELGYATAKEIAILLVSTDFISHCVIEGETFVFEPIIYASASSVVRLPIVEETEATFLENLYVAQEKVLQAVTKEVQILLQSPRHVSKGVVPEKRFDDTLNIYVEFGGEQFEWQTKFADELSKLASKSRNLTIHRPRRYQNNGHRGVCLDTLIEEDLAKVRCADLVITCSDAEESPASSAFVQGYARGLDKEVWLYNSKKTNIVGSGGYQSSRNIMLDYSADKVFAQFDQLKAALKKRANVPLSDER